MLYIKAKNAYINAENVNRNEQSKVKESEAASAAAPAPDDTENTRMFC